MPGTKSDHKDMRYVTVVLSLITVLILTFFVFDAVDGNLLADPEFLLKRGGIAAASAGFILLVADIFLPIPSSLVMLANGSVFGTWIGTILSTLGGFSATMLAFWLGRKSAGLLGRIIPEKDARSARLLLLKWGPFGLMATRPIPIMAETVAFMAGASNISAVRAAIAAFIGTIPQALIYSLLGAKVVTSATLFATIVAGILVAGIYAGLGMILGVTPPKNKSATF